MKCQTAQVDFGYGWIKTQDNGSSSKQKNHYGNGHYCEGSGKYNCWRGASATRDWLLFQWRKVGSGERCGIPCLDHILCLIVFIWLAATTFS
jgi:hypothetical protein